MRIFIFNYNNNKHFAPKKTELSWNDVHISFSKFVIRTVNGAECECRGLIYMNETYQREIDFENLEKIGNDIHTSSRIPLQKLH